LSTAIGHRSAARRPLVVQMAFPHRPLKSSGVVTAGLLSGMMAP
jgi:hypothetical protein